MHGHYHHQQEDISRILDPSYASSSSSPYHHTTHSSKHTQYHDPDYHYFPSTYSQSPKSKKQKRNSLEGRPSWELGQGLEETEEWGVYYNDGAEDDEFPSSSPTYHHVSTRRRRRENTVTSTNTYSSSLTPPSTSSSYTSTTTAASSGPSTPRSYNATLSDSDLPHCHHHHKLTKRLWPEHVHPFSSQDNFQDDEDEEADVSVPTKEKSQPQSQATCGEAMKKQWHAMSLSVRFGVFRAQRRVKEALKR
ncbi:hypothetical protein VNI00_014125 [Paramarasmius palmivorus]|uniref:Uncharacterized protein n=1 Tax=Paramarasmius palmivorus TaxID=297713 RepID=A0AAW0BWB9_9AGAR